MSAKAKKSASPAYTIITIVMDILVAAAVVLVVHLVVSFFGAASSHQLGKGVLGLTRLAVLPLGIADVKTPYGGVFDLNATATVLLLLAAEWVLGLVRRTAG